MNCPIPSRKRKKPALLQAFPQKQDVVPQIDALSQQFPIGATNLFISESMEAYRMQDIYG